MESRLKWLTDIWPKLGRTKTLGAGVDVMETQLKRCLSTFDIVLLGIGHMVGSGVYVLTSSVARNIAGPAIVVSFVISGFASLLAALCYSEFSVRFPRAGSAYSYAYLAVGELWAFIVGWNMVLENVIGTAAVSRACSAYVDSLLGGAIRNYTLASLSNAIGLNAVSEHADIFAFSIVIAFMVFLTCGVRVTTYLNNLFSMINIGIILGIIVVGFYFSDLHNWTDVKGGFMPFGWKGVFGASASCFYAYIGFDSIATSGEEARDPQRSIPIATMIAMGFATLAYVGVSAVLTLMVPYYDITAESGLPDALGMHGAAWAKLVVILGACCGMVTVLIGTLYALTRIVYSMADDGLLFSWMGTVNEKTQIPLLAMYFFASLAAILALFLDITTLIEMMSIGTLMAYLVVSASVIIVRYQPISEPVHQSLSSDINNQELNDLSADSPGSEGKQLFDDNFAEERKANSIQNVIKKYLAAETVVSKLNEVAPDLVVPLCVLIMTIVIFALCSLGPALLEASKRSSLWLAIIVVLLIILAASFLIITFHEQNASQLRYKVPFVPFVPTLSIVFNVALMTNLQALTWFRLLVWMIFGFFVYFCHGIKYSKLDPNRLSIGGKDVRNWGSIDDSANLPDNASVLSTY